MPMRENLTYAIEDYLKAVYELTRSGGRATTTQLSELLGVTPASVTGMVQKLQSHFASGLKDVMGQVMALQGEEESKLSTPVTNNPPPNNGGLPSASALATPDQKKAPVTTTEAEPVEPISQSLAQASAVPNRPDTAPKEN